MLRVPTLSFFTAFFIASIGSSLGQNAILSRVGIVGEAHGREFFSKVVFATFFPTLFVSLIQSRFNEETRGSQQRRTPEEVNELQRQRNLAQSLSAFGVTLFFLFLATIVPRTPEWVLAEASAIGASCTVIFNAFQQTASSVVDEDERQKALVAFLLGYQLSGLVVLLADTICGSRLDKDRQSYFFALITFIFCLCLFCCVQAHHQLEAKSSKYASHPDSSRFMNMSDWHRDVDALLDDDDDEEEAEELKIDQNQKIRTITNDHSSTSSSSSYSISPLLVGAMFLTVMATSSLLPFYSHFESSKPDINLPQSLFFLRLVSDAISRPSTLLLSRFAANARVIMALAISRLILLAPLLSLAGAGAVEGKLGSVQSGLASALVCFFSFGSGFIITRVYQVALHRVNVKHQPQITSTLNNVFAAAVSASAVIGLLAQHY